MTTNFLWLHSKPITVLVQVKLHIRPPMVVYYSNVLFFDSLQWLVKFFWVRSGDWLVAVAFWMEQWSDWLQWHFWQKLVWLVTIEFWVGTMVWLLQWHFEHEQAVSQKHHSTGSFHAGSGFHRVSCNSSELTSLWIEMAGFYIPIDIFFFSTPGWLRTGHCSMMTSCLTGV